MEHLLKQQWPIETVEVDALTWVKYILDELDPNSLPSMCCCTRSRILSSCRKWTSCLVGCTLTSTFWGLISKLAWKERRETKWWGKSTGWLDNVERPNHMTSKLKIKWEKPSAISDIEGPCSFQGGHNGSPHCTDLQWESSLYKASSMYTEVITGQPSAL